MQSPCQVVGSGPFKCQAYVAGSHSTLEKNADYFVSGRPYLDGVTIFPIPDANTRLAAMKAGVIDAVPWGIYPYQVSDLDSFPVIVQQVPQNWATTLIMNTTVSPFDDIRVRNAINLQLDRNEIVGTLGGMVGGLMMPGGQWALPEFTLLARDRYGDLVDERELARQLMVDAGFPDGFSIEILASTLLPKPTAAELVADQLLLLDIDATVLIKSGTQYSSDRNSMNYDLAIDTVAEPLDDVDLMFSKEYLSAAPENHTGLFDSQMETLFVTQQQVQQQFVSTRLGKVHDLINRTMDQNAFLALDWQKRYVPVSNLVADFQIHPNLVQNLRWQDVWFADSPVPTPTPTATPTPIPGLSGPGLLLLAGLLMLSYLLVWKRRSPTGENRIP